MTTSRLPFKARPLPRQLFLTPSALVPPADMAERVLKIPMPDADREMLIMRIEQHRTHLDSMAKIIATTLAAMSAVYVSPSGNEVPVADLRSRFEREAVQAFWTDQLVLMNDAARWPEEA